MPWDVKRDNRCKKSKPFGVVKRGDNALEGCHATRAKANRQLAALNASETNKEVDVEKELENKESENLDKSHVDSLETEDSTKEQDEKAVQHAEIVSPWVPFGVTSFEELEAAQQAKVTAQMAETLSEQFKDIVSNIMMSPEIEDKAAAVTALASEFEVRINRAMEQKEKWQPITDKLATKVDEMKQRVMKTEGGVKFPAGDFAFTPDKEKPSTWKLRLAENRPGNITKRQLGRAAAALSSGGFRGRRVQLPSSAVAGVKRKIRAAYRKLGVKASDIPASVKEQSFSVWKEKDGSYRWLTVYSNNYRDDDNPAEIISAEAHKDFVKAVDDGEWPYPELWYWHVPGTRMGQADLVAYEEDTGFALAAGTVDSGKEHIAESVKEREDQLVSHGMPSNEIERNDESDPTVITRYRTKEISPLPADAAANKYTGFVYQITKEEKDMIPENKRAELESLGFDVDELEAQLEASQNQAEVEGRESKEVEPTKGEPTQDKSEEVTEAVEPVTEPAPEATLSSNDVVEAIATTIGDAIAPLVQRIEALETGAKEKAAEPLSPADAFNQLLRSRVIGSESASVDGRTKEAKDGPEETLPEFKPIINTGNPFADTVVSRIARGDTFKELQEAQRNREV